MPAVFVYFVYTNYILSKYSWLISLGLDVTESVIHVFSHVDGSAHYWLRDSLQNSIAVEQKVQRLNHFLNETKCFQYYLSQSKLSNQSGQNWTFPPQHSLNQLIFLCSIFSVFNKALHREYERFELQALEVYVWGPNVAEETQVQELATWNFEVWKVHLSCVLKTATRSILYPAVQQKVQPQNHFLNETKCCQ